MARISTDRQTADTDGRHDYDPYRHLRLFTTRVTPAPHAILGRDQLIRVLKATFARPEISNAILLAEAGTGKTSLVQELARQDTTREYWEVNIPSMIARARNPAEDLAPLLRSVFSETEAYNRTHNTEIVLFIDEFHQIIQLSPAAVEALKPVLAQSSARGIRVIAATTLAEYHEFIAPNLPLAERLQRINIAPPSHAVIIDILMDIAKRNKAPLTRDLAELIYDYAQRYIPASAQPRKSILLLDAMIGWYRSGMETGDKVPMNERLLGRVIEENANVSVDLNTDPESIVRRINDHVIAQEWAAQAIGERMNICMAGLNDPTRPMASFLFAGSTGVGKTEVVKQMTRALFGEDMRHLIRFDMSEYSLDESVDRFRTSLADYIWNMPYAVVLLDEIDKAAPNIRQLLLQVLDDGRLSDANGRQITFTNAYIVMTTNAGTSSEIFSRMATYAPSDTGSGKRLHDWMAVIRRTLTSSGSKEGFAPEFLGRIDAIIPFQPLSQDTKRTITEHRLDEQRHRVAVTHDIALDWDQRLITYISEEKSPDDSDVNAGGARYIMNVIESDVMAPVAAYINQHPACTRITIGVDGRMRVEDSKHRIGDASIMVKGDGAGQGKATQNQRKTPVIKTLV